MAERDLEAIAVRVEEALDEPYPHDRYSIQKDSDIRALLVEVRGLRARAEVAEARAIEGSLACTACHWVGHVSECKPSKGEPLGRCECPKCGGDAEGAFWWRHEYREMTGLLPNAAYEILGSDNYNESPAEFILRFSDRHQELKDKLAVAEAEHTRLRKQNGILASRAAELHEIVGAAKVSFEGLKDARVLSRACHAYVVNATTEDGCRWCSPNGEMDDPDAHAEWCPVRLAIYLRFALRDPSRPKHAWPWCTGLGNDVAWRVLELAAESLERGKPQPGGEE